MKTFLLTLALSLFSVFPTQIGTVKITGNIDLHPGETTVLTVTPSEPSYIYEWEIQDEDKHEKSFSFLVSGNTLTITHLGYSQYGLVDIGCRVYHADGTYIGSDWVEIVVQP